MTTGNTDRREQQIISLALQVGFHDAAFLNVSELVVRSEYRKYCEMNLCGQYGVNPACPPQCGTVEELTAKTGQFPRALVLQTLHDSDFVNDAAGARQAKAAHNRLADRLMALLPECGGAYLRMSAGPWRGDSCMSAYCVDTQCMADSVHMECWANDGKGRFFSILLFQ